MLRCLSLFSGIGAFEVALNEEDIEWELDHYCEIDKYACQSYNCIHGTTDKDNLKDVTNIDYSKIGDIDLVTYGFPCQDISLAGNQKGFFDEDGNLTRSGLFFNAANVIRHINPKFAIFENVKNLTGKKFKAEFETVLYTLDELGYNTYWKVLNAKDYGIPQNRERVFGISIRKDIDHGYIFPQGFELKLRLKDILEDGVDEKYYLSQDKVDKFSDKFGGEPYQLLGGEQENQAVKKDGISTTLTSSMGCGGGYVPMINEPIIKKVGSINLGNNESNNRVYSPEGLSPTLNTMQGGHRQPKIIEPLICASRGRNPDDPSSRKAGDHTEQRIEVNTKGLANTLTTVQKDNLVLEANNNNNFRIRKLTPRECWRLMGFKDHYFNKVKGVSNTQLYKQAGNSIVVDALRYIFRELKNQYPDYFKENEWGSDL